MITVIVPAYNHEDYVLECLESIHNQTYRNFQWIVVDDGSRDSTPEILKQHQSKYGYELYLQENKGLSRTLTDTIKYKAKGDYITICASDDAWLPNRVEIFFNFMESHPEYSMCFSRYYFMNEKSEIIGKRADKKLRGGYIFEDIICRRFQPGNSIMYKKNALESVGYYKDGVIAEDFYINCRLSYSFEIGFIDEYLSYYRVAPMEKKRDPYKLVLSHKETLREYKGFPIYRKAVYAWNLRSALVLSSYNKYKFKTILLLISSGIYSFKRENLPYLRNTLNNLLFCWVRL